MAFGKCKSKLFFDSSKSEKKSVSNSFILPGKINTAKWDTALATIIVLECIYAIEDVNSFGIGLNTKTFKIEIQFNATRGLYMNSVVFLCICWARKGIKKLTKT